MADALVGYFRTRTDAERAYNALLAENYSQAEVGLVTADSRRTDAPDLGPRPETGSQNRAGSDAVIGGLAGLAAGMVAAVLPGIGALLAVGPLAGAIGGLGIGAAAGGLIGLLQDQGISESEARLYAEGMRRGGAIVTVHGVSGMREEQARDILDHQGAVDLEVLKEEWTEGQTPSRTPTGPLGTERR
jgi:hypothetical protein